MRSVSKGKIDLKELGITKEEYTDEQFLIDFPEKLVKCSYCKKKFATQKEDKYCSDNCWIKRVIKNKIYKRKHYVKSGRRS